VSLRLLRVRDPAMRSLLARLRAGEDFGALAREASLDPSAPSGGALGAVTLGDLAAPLRRAAAALSPGETSPVVATDQGYVILRRER
jgi:parvulin-like peptidyl-prolyl isomerase